MAIRTSPYRAKYTFSVLYKKDLDVLEMNAFDLMNRLSVIYDARQQWKVDHKLADILLLVICAVIAGCEGWEEIEDFGNERLDWLKKYGECVCYCKRIGSWSN